VATVFRLVLEQLEAVYRGLIDAAGSSAVPAWAVAMVLTGTALSAAIRLVRRYAPEASGSGVHEIEGALGDERPLRWRRVIPVKFGGALLSLGGGLALGREGPSVQIGGSIGQMLGERLRLTPADCHIMVAAGAAAGLAAAFNAPLAGTLFVFEEMRPQFRYSVLSVQCVLLAAVNSDIVARFATYQTPVIHMQAFPPPPLASLWLFPIFGIACGVFGVLFNAALVSGLDLVGRLRGFALAWRGAYVGAMVGLLGWWWPAAVGGGYDVITQALHMQFSAALLLLLFVVRFGTTQLSYWSGAPGGIFAPMMALGTLFGMWFGHGAAGPFPTLVPHAGVFAVAGMAALFSATVRAPLTGVALAVEMTGNYDQILPLILTCVSATVAAAAVGGRPIYTVLLERVMTRQAAPSEGAPS
jgi:CIC family chloride channel protein